MLETKLAVFKGKKIRKLLYKDEWWFAVSDVIEVLTDSTDVKQYVKKMRQRDLELDTYWGTNCTPLEILAPDGKIRRVSGNIDKMLGWGQIVTLLSTHCRPRMFLSGPALECFYRGIQVHAGDSRQKPAGMTPSFLKEGATHG